MEFITADEKVLIEKRLEELKGRRTTLSKRIGEARAQGDLSENAEYHACREEQGLNEAEIRRLSEKLKTAKVTDGSAAPSDMAFVGSVLTLKDLATGREDVYRIVGQASGKFDSDEIEVTAASPMGEALMKARAGDTIKVDLPRGTKRFEVVSIQ